MFRVKGTCNLATEVCLLHTRETVCNADVRIEPWTDEVTGASEWDKAAEVQWSNIKTHALPSRDTSSELAYLKMEAWIESCLRDHEHCRKSRSSQLPKRVLEISGSFVYLRESQEKRGRYACLSHCWGEKGPSLRLNQTADDALRRGITKAELPRPFADAIEVCSKLCIPYLWIDALCKHPSSKDIRFRFSA
jgi:hypothetical protein